MSLIPAEHMITPRAPIAPSLETRGAGPVSPAGGDFAARLAALLDPGSGTTDPQTPPQPFPAEASTVLPLASEPGVYETGGYEAGTAGPRISDSGDSEPGPSEPRSDVPPGYERPLETPAGAGRPDGPPRAVAGVGEEPAVAAREAARKLLEAVSGEADPAAPAWREDLKKLLAFLEQKLRQRGPAGGSGRPANGPERASGSAAAAMIGNGEPGRMAALRELLAAFLQDGAARGGGPADGELSGLRDLLKGLAKRLEGRSVPPAGGLAGASRVEAAPLAGAMAARSAEPAGGKPSASIAKERRELRVRVLDLRRDSAARDPAARGEAAAGGRGLSQRTIAELEPSPLPGGTAGLRPVAGDGGWAGRYTGESAAAESAREAVHGFVADPRERLIPEIVRHAGIVLRDGGKGEIRLVLKPEALGSVRVHIQMQDNSVEARIIVDNMSIKELIEGNLDELRAALQEEGFQSTALNVAVGGEGSGRDGEGQERAVERTGQAARELARAVPLLDEWVREDLLVDLVV